MANEKLSLSERQAIARRLAEERGISYKSALRSVQRYLAITGQRRGIKGGSGIQQFRREEERIRPKRIGGKGPTQEHHTDAQAERLYDLGFSNQADDYFVWYDDGAQELCDESDECREDKWYFFHTFQWPSINGAIAMAESVLHGEDRRVMERISSACVAVIRIEIRWFHAEVVTRRGRGPRGERNVEVREHEPDRWAIEVTWCRPKS